MGRGQGGSKSYGKRTPGGIKTSSAIKMSSVGEIEAKHGVLGEDSAVQSSRIRDIVDDGAARAIAPEFAAKAVDKAQAKKQAQLRKRLDLFRQRFDKTKQENDGRTFDEAVVGSDIERWERAFNKKTPGVKSLEQYKTHEELNSAMADLRTVGEEELEREVNKKKIMKDSLLKSDGVYDIYEADNAKAISTLAEGSKWCIQNPETAKSYLEKDGNFTMIYKNGKPMFAVQFDEDSGNKGAPEVWLHSDFALRSGQNYLGTNTIKPVLLREDFDYINKYLEERGKEPLLETGSHIFESREALNEHAREIFGKDPGSFEAKSLVLGYREEYPEDVEKMIRKDLQLAISRAGALRKRIPEIEDRVVEDGVNSIVDYAVATGGRFKKGEPLLFSSIKEKPQAFIRYVRDVVKRRMPEGEEVVLSDPQLIIDYAKAIGGRFPEGEAVLADNTWYAVGYAEAIGERFPEGEEAIAATPASVLQYAKIIKGRFPAGEKLDMFRENPWYALEYAKAIGERFPEGEAAIMSDENIAAEYKAFLANL